MVITSLVEAGYFPDDLPADIWDVFKLLRALPTADSDDFLRASKSVLSNFGFKLMLFLSRDELTALSRNSAYITAPNTGLLVF